MWILIKETINLEIMVKPTFLLVCTSAFCSMIGFFVPLFFLPDFAVLKGIDRSNANFLISIYGKFVRQTIQGRKLFSEIWYYNFTGALETTKFCVSTWYLCFYPFFYS